VFGGIAGLATLVIAGQLIGRQLRIGAGDLTARPGGTGARQGRARRRRARPPRWACRRLAKVVAAVPGRMAGRTPTALLLRAEPTNSRMP
jgi:hypothetical protein